MSKATQFKDCATSQNPNESEKDDPKPSHGVRTHRSRFNSFQNLEQNEMAFPASGGLRYGSARCPPAAPDGGYAAEPRSDRRRFGGFSEKPPEKMGTHHGDKAGDFPKMSPARVLVPPLITHKSSLPHHHRHWSFVGCASRPLGL